MEEGVSIIAGGLLFVFVAFLTRVLRRSLIAFWKNGGMWGIRVSEDEAKRSHRKLVTVSLVGGLGFVLLGISDLIVTAWSR
jgi:hypothetical protein